ncbi:MAG TPA: HipA family kinase [Candidatus Angelobacter sp.]|jgi:hypothetical protein
MQAQAVLPLSAVQQIRRMRGGSQSQLMRASDGNYYITKFQGNPQHTRVLANEFLASRLGSSLGLPMPEVAVLYVSDWLIENTPELRFDVAGLGTACRSGLQLGSRYVADPEKDMVFDYLPESLMLKKTRNLQDFARVLVLDKWAGNADGRQVVFTKPATARKYSSTFIDQGYCFNCSESNFPDSPLRGVFARILLISTSADGTLLSLSLAAPSRWTVQSFGRSPKGCRTNGGPATALLLIWPG